MRADQLTGELAQIKIFHGLVHDELVDIAKKCHYGTCEGNKLLLCEGTQVNDVFFVRSGRVQVEFQISHALHPDKVIVEILGTGEMFAWSALLESKLTASIRTLEATDFLSICVTDLLTLFEKRPRIGYIVMKNVNHVISSRLEKSRRQLMLALEGIGEY